MGNAIAISTYADLLDRAHCMIGYCSRCQHSADVDLEAIVAAGRGGESYIGRTVRCSRCGHHDSPIIMARAARERRSD